MIDYKKKSVNYGPKMLSSSFKNNISTSKKSYLYTYMYIIIYNIAIFIPPLPGGGGGYTVLPHIFLSNYRWQKSDIWSYRYAILWVAFLDLSDSYFLFADLVGFYAHFSQQLLMAEIW